MDITMRKTQNYPAHHAAVQKTTPKCKTPTPVIHNDKLGFDLAAEPKSTLSSDLIGQWGITKFFRKLFHFIIHDLLG